MKIIGEARHGAYICEISNEEIRKVLDKAYNDAPHIAVGGEIDLAGGYNFRNDIKRVCADMQQAMNRFEQARDTLLRFANMVTERDSDQTCS